MTHQSRGNGDAYGIALATDSGRESLACHLSIVPAQMVYMQIPARDLRNVVDGIFPSVARNPIADCARGFGHRYRAGHDLLLDVPATMGRHGIADGLRQAAHIVLTDFPTKAGIPIPGFSQSGLGQLIERAGIHSGWLQLSFFDSGVGILALADSASSLAQALHGALPMDFGTACQTFGAGSVELGLAMSTQNPLLLAGGLQDLLAGVVSTWQAFSVYVDPLELLGASGFSALLGFGIAHGLVGEDLKDSTLDAIRSGAMGALYKVSAAFGYGALAGLLVCRLACALARKHDREEQAQLSVDEHSCRLLIRELCSGNTDVLALLKGTEAWESRTKSEELATSDLTLHDDFLDRLGSYREYAPILDDEFPDRLGGCMKIAPILREDCSDRLGACSKGAVVLRDDPPDLLKLYRLCVADV